MFANRTTQKVVGGLSGEIWEMSRRIVTVDSCVLEIVVLTCLLWTIEELIKFGEVVVRVEVSASAACR